MCGEVRSLCWEEDRESIDLVFGALEAIIIQINKGKEYGLKWKRKKILGSAGTEGSKLAICIQGRLPHLESFLLSFRLLEDFHVLF